MKKTNKHNNSTSSPTEMFVSGMTTISDNYPHLMVFLHREKPSNYKSDFNFLMVTQDSFGKIELLDMDFKDGHVILLIKDCATGKTGDIRIDINDKEQRFLFICWQDVKNLVRADSHGKACDSKLLEFEF